LIPFIAINDMIFGVASAALLVGRSPARSRRTMSRMLAQQLMTFVNDRSVLSHNALKVVVSLAILAPHLMYHAA
jgi:hypothetical protein